jgi:mono/diheme cytochrome c family protein
MRLGVAVLAMAIPAAAHVTVSTKITWSREVARIVNQRCLECHRAGGPAPFSLETYEEARPWAKAIQEEVLSRRMPPWGAVKGFGDFRHDPGLTQEEVNLIAEWAEGGAPEGDPNLLPPKRRVFPEAERPAGALKPLPPVYRIRAPQIVTALRTSSTARVMAVLPDGSREPLLWVIAAPNQPRDYILAEPLRLPAGTVLETEGEAQAYFKAPPPSRRTAPNSPSRRVQTAPTRGAAPAGERSR